MATFDLPVYGINGPICSIRAAKGKTGGDIKNEIEKATGVPRAQQRLLVGTTRFHDHQELRDHPVVCPEGSGSEPLTLIRHLPIILPPSATPDEWFALYAYEYGERTKDGMSFKSFVQNRGGRISWGDATRIVKLYEDPSVALALLPEPKQHPQPTPQISKAETSTSDAQPTVSVQYRTVEDLAGAACAICLDESTDVDAEVVELLCGGSHRFHKRCIDEWLAGVVNGKVASHSGLFGDAGATGSTGAEAWSYFSPGATRVTKGRARCPCCRGEAQGQVAAKSSGVFVSKPTKTTADAAFRK